MVHIAEKKLDCTGCGACAQSCNRKCIEMQYDAEGFVYPVVDMAACIKCERCETVCPVIMTKEGSKQQPKCFVAYTKDESIRLESSSGGIFTVLAETVIRRGGVVFGAAFDKDFSVHHIMVNTIEDLGLLRGSKYVQSNLQNTFHEAKTILMSGRMVLFSGAPCQIAGLKGYLRKQYDNLLTIDILCHGVPSPLLWEKYLREKENQFGSSLKSVSFRQKDLGWNVFSMKMVFSNGAIYSKPFYEDSFMRLFLRNICLRPSCHNCQFKGLDRLSDITIGDCWGVEKTMPQMFDDNGTSVVLIHTPAGEALFSACTPQITCEIGKVDTVLPISADSRKSVLAHNNRKQFFKALGHGKSIDELCGLLEPTFLQKCKCRVFSIFVKIKSAVSS